MKLTKQHLKQIISEALEEMRIGPVAGLRGGHDMSTHSPVEEFLKKYNFLEKDVGDDGEIIIYFDDSDSARILSKDVPEGWDVDHLNAGRYAYHTGEYVR